MTTNRIIYKVYPHTDEIRQETTSVNLTGVPRDRNFWNYVEEVIRERFYDYNIRFNHAGLTVGIFAKGDTDIENY